MFTSKKLHLYPTTERSGREKIQAIETTRALKIQSVVPDCCWSDCVFTATYITNMLPSVILKGRAPLEILFGKKSDFSQLRTFGYLCLTTNNIPHKGKFITLKRATRFLTLVHMLYKFREDAFPFKGQPSTVTSDIPVGCRSYPYR